MARTPVADELGLTDEDLNALDELDSLIGNTTTPLTIDDDDDDDDDEEEIEEEEEEIIEVDCPVCERSYDSLPELEFHLKKRHPDYEAPVDEVDEDEEDEAATSELDGDDLDDDGEDLVAEVTRKADRLEKALTENNLLPTPPRQKRRRRTKVEIAAAKADVARQRAQEKPLPPEETRTAASNREYLADVMGKDDDAAIERDRQQALARLKAPGMTTLAAEPDTQPDTLTGFAVPDYVPPSSMKGVGDPFAMDVRIPADRNVPYVRVKFSISGDLDQVGRALAEIGDIFRQRNIEFMAGVTDGDK